MMEPNTQMKVRDVMVRGVVTVDMDASLKEIVKTLLNEGVSGLVVVSPDDEVMGIVSEIDIIRVIGEDWNRLTAEDIMSSPVKTIKPGMTLKDAVDVMKNFDIHNLVVLHGIPGRSHDIPVGIICASDILRAAFSSQK